jgi:hypothetical protein
MHACMHTIGRCACTVKHSTRSCQAQYISMHGVTIYRLLYYDRSRVATHSCTRTLAHSRLIMRVHMQGLIAYGVRGAIATARLPGPVEGPLTGLHIQQLNYCVVVSDMHRRMIQSSCVYIHRRRSCRNVGR